jgi:nitrogen-specific signal transduction histidine kinase
VASVNLRARILDRHGQGANENVRRQAAQFRAMPELCQLLDALPHPLLILNEEREIVFANRRLMDLIGLANPESVHGLRPGDVLNCEHAWNDRGGCGTTEACQVCGAACAISHAQHGTEATQECRILQTEGAALDLHAISTLFCLAGESFTVLALTDVSHEKRRQVLERVFFHDMLNVTASLMGYADLLVRVPTEEVPELSRLIARCVRDLANELRSHRDLALAEAHDLKVHWEPVNTHQVMARGVLCSTPPLPT